MYGPQDRGNDVNKEGLHKPRRRDKYNRDSSGIDSDNQSTGNQSQGTDGESSWIISELNSLNSDCITNFRITSLNSNSISTQDNATATRESEKTTQYFGGGGGEGELIKPTLIDTGAWQSYVTYLLQVE